MQRPQRRIAGVVEHGLQRAGIIAVVARRDLGAVDGGDRHRLDEGFLHAAGDVHALGLDDIAVRIGERGIADTGEVARRLLVAQVVADDDVAAVVHGGAALRADHVGGAVIDQRVGLDLGRRAGLGNGVEEAGRQELGGGGQRRQRRGGHGKAEHCAERAQPHLPPRSRRIKLTSVHLPC